MFVCLSVCLQLKCIVSVNAHYHFDIYFVTPRTAGKINIYKNFTCETETKADSVV